MSLDKLELPGGAMSGLVANAVEISTTHYLVAVVFLRSVEAQMRGGAIEPGDVLVIREGAEPLH